MKQIIVRIIKTKCKSIVKYNNIERAIKRNEIPLNIDSIFDFFLKS